MGTFSDADEFETCKMLVRIFSGRDDDEESGARALQSVSRLRRAWPLPIANSIKNLWFQEGKSAS